MPEFQHSIVLFTGIDGLPLEFNVRNTKDKSYLKELIEHGGGFCTQSDNAVHLISPGTKVLNVDSGKKLVSSSYIYECVKQNYLLDVNDYVFTISEARTSDISDEDSEKLLGQYQSTCKSPTKCPIGGLRMDISPIKASNNIIDVDSSTTSNLTGLSSHGAVPQASNSSSTHSESFVEGSQDVSSNVKITSHAYFGTVADALQKSPELMNSPSKLIAGNAALEVKSPYVALVSNDYKHNSLLSKKLEFDNVNKPSTIVSPVKEKDIYEESPLNASNSFSVNALSRLSSIHTRKIDNENDFVSPNVSKRSIISSHCEMSPKKSSLEICEENISSFRNNLVEVKQNAIQSPLVVISPLKLSNKSAKLLSNKANEITHEVNTTVSSSQPEDENLDQFDNMLLNKIQKPQSEDEESLSQSYTVSSSADAQISSKPCSIEKEQKNDSAALPDSPSLYASQVNESDYLRNLEAEVKEILLKSSPKSIQDKIALVKYVCCARKLPPATVLESLITKSSN